MAKKEQPRFFATYNQRVMAYQKCPGLLAEDLLMVFGLIKTDEDKGVHNHVIKKVLDFCPNIESLLVNVARAIVKTSKECHDPKPSPKHD